MARKTGDGYSSKLSKDLSILMNYGKDEPSNEKDPAGPDDNVVVTATCRLPDVELYETTVCTPDIPADAVAEAVVGLMEQIRHSGVDVLQHEITLSFSRASDLG
jgi:hypothetical protein